MFNTEDFPILYEAVRLYRDEFSTHLQGLRQTEYNFAAATIALAKIEGLLVRIEREVKRNQEQEEMIEEVKRRLKEVI